LGTEAGEILDSGTEKLLNKERHDKVQSSAVNEEKRDEAEAMLEMQQSLLQNIASTENAVKGFPNTEAKFEGIKSRDPLGYSSRRNSG
jgi:hypothetical protein